jgi:hypothetical protein
MVFWPLLCYLSWGLTEYKQGAMVAMKEKQIPKGCYFWAYDKFIGD